MTRLDIDRVETGICRQTSRDYKDILQTVEIVIADKRVIGIYAHK